MLVHKGPGKKQNCFTAVISSWIIVPTFASRQTWRLLMVKQNVVDCLLVKKSPLAQNACLSDCILRLEQIPDSMGFSTSCHRKYVVPSPQARHATTMRRPRPPAPQQHGIPTPMEQSVQFSSQVQRWMQAEHSPQSGACPSADLPRSTR